MSKYSVSKTDPLTRAAIKRRTAAMLPDRPTQMGLKPADIRAALYEAIISSTGKGSLMDELDRLVDEVNAALAALEVRAGVMGTVTVPASDWVDATPTKATVALEGLEDSTVTLLLPADDATVAAAGAAGVKVLPDTVDAEAGTAVVMRGEAVPLIDLNFTYMVFHGEADEARRAVVALVGVSAGSGTDEAAVEDALAKAKESGAFDGTSVTVESVTESDESGGENVVTFSDGNTLTVRNGKDGTGASGSGTVDILLPASDVAVVGREYNIYKDTVVFSSLPVESYDITIQLDDTSVQAYNYHEVWRFVPATAGTYTLTINVRDVKTGKSGVYATKTMTLYVVEDTEVADRNVLFIGDSLTYAGIYTAEIQHNLSGGGITSVGTVERTRTIDGVSLTSLCEGRNGWATWDYAGTYASSTSKFLSSENVFRNPDTGLFDLGYYMETYHAGVTLHAVCLNLGTNGIGAQATTVAGMDELITRIRAYSSALPILIHIPIPVAKQDYRAYIADQKNASSPYIRMRWYDLAKAYIDAYDGTMENVYLMPVYLNMDVEHDFPTEVVAASARNPATVERVTDGHPNTYGYLKMADVYYAHLLRYMYDDGVTYYTVTNNLTNVTNSNGAKSVKEGASYSATLTVVGGYVLSEVSVTMGGEAVTVTDGVISIESVTGDIVITATAVADESGEAVAVNLVDPSTANDESPNTTDLFADEWLNGYGITYSSGLKIVEYSGRITTDLIPITIGRTYQITGINVSSATYYNYFRLVFFNSQGATVYSSYLSPFGSACTNLFDDGNEAEYDDATNTVTLDTTRFKSVFANAAYCRFMAYPAGANEDITVTEVE